MVQHTNEVKIQVTIFGLSEHPAMIEVTDEKEVQAIFATLTGSEDPERAVVTLKELLEIIPERVERGYYRIGALALDSGNYRVTYDNNPIGLTRIEFRLLKALISRSEHVVSHEELAQFVWGHDMVDDRTIKVHIRRLRIKLARGSAILPAIVSVRGYGYKITME